MVTRLQQIEIDHDMVACCLDCPAAMRRASGLGGRSTDHPYRSAVDRPTSTCGGGAHLHTLQDRTLCSHFRWYDDTDITLKGSTITFVVDGIRWSDPILCVVNYTTRVFPINAYPPGSYTLVARLRYQNFFGQLIVDTFGTVDFDVTGSPTTPQPVPTSNGYWLWLLTAGIAILTARFRCVGLS